MWEEYALIENAHLQCFFMPLTVRLNDLQPEMEGIVPKTDTRWRQDLRLFEDDRIEESETEKEKIEGRQRRERKKVEDGLVPAHKPRWFECKKHPYMTTEYWNTGEEPPMFYEFIEGENGYWERRERGEWPEDLPNLWGPYDDE